MNAANFTTFSTGIGHGSQASIIDLLLEGDLGRCLEDSKTFKFLVWSLEIPGGPETIV